MQTGTESLNLVITGPLKINLKVSGSDLTGVTFPTKQELIETLIKSLGSFYNGNEITITIQRDTPKHIDKNIVKKIKPRIKSKLIKLLNLNLKNDEKDGFIDGLLNINELLQTLSKFIALSESENKANYEDQINDFNQTLNNFRTSYRLGNKQVLSNINKLCKLGFIHNFTDILKYTYIINISNKIHFEQNINQLSKLT